MAMIKKINVKRDNMSLIVFIDTEIHPKSRKVIDTLFLSPLLFPAKPYHSLLKDDKIQTEEMNNPLNDAIKARDLFYDEVEAFKNIDEELKQIF